MSLLHKKLRNKFGFTLLEVVVAIGLTILLSASVTTVYLTTVKVYNLNQDRSTSTTRNAQGFQRMVDELQQADGIRNCSSTILDFSVAGTVSRYRFTSNQLRRYPTPSSTTYEVLAKNVRAPTVGIGIGFTCNSGSVTLKLTSYNPAATEALSTHSTGYLEATVTPRGIPKNLASWWKLDDGSGATAYDFGGRFATGIGYGGTAHYLMLYGSTPTWTTGVATGAISLTASNYDYLYMGSSGGMFYGELDNGQSHTISMWINATTLPTFSLGDWAPLFFASGCGGGLAIASDGMFYYEGQWPPPQVSVQITTGVWHHIAFTFDDSNSDGQNATGKFYLDGVLKGTVNPVWTAENNWCYYDTIGGDQNTSFFNGKVDDIRFYDAVLSADEIAKLARYVPYISSSTPATADILTDTSNCGAIGTVCNGGTPSCVKGKCCASGQINCLVSGVPTCVTASSNNSHCGNCGNACAGGTTCSNGYCCTTGLTDCFSTYHTCIDVSSDDTNCGSCGNSCDTDSGEACCSSSCANLNSDGYNCGACGNICSGGGEGCYGAACVACTKYGLEECDLSCVDLQTDNNNCGACGNLCDTGGKVPQSCDGGICK